ncbi:alkaline phosphatase family protein [Jatrophihabitans endophyticus]|uniref:alkaline phosphatase family protein n=1 Tax=Jatrophihabitans endophyticus TaxID=1206085 RepID=UPI0019F8FCCF|nr:alkaline phosphatase family protein [Jatrophihabitans endophyticus]MBE7189231.1 alkaline phosphatase family protein [Jatrophihabitans endophyticus]
MVSGSVRRRLALGRRLVRTWRPTGVAVTDLVRSVATSFVALGLTLYLIPGDQTSGPQAVALLVLIVVGVGIVLRPLLLGTAVVFGSVGLLLVGVLAQAVVLYVAVAISPDVHISSYPRVFLVSWVAAVIAALVNWLLDAGSQDAFLAQLLGRAVRIAHRQARLGDAPVGEPGLLVVQLDGVGRDLMRQAVVAGAVPTVARWLRTGTHRPYRWHTGLPATTPAGQAVLLHGDRHEVPSFRWFEKDSGRLLVANRAADAATIEARLSTGRGLLADGGVSISNLFSGDAPTRILTMSDARLPARTTRGLATFATTPRGLARTLVLFVAQVVQEMYQARRQRRRDVRPRVARGGVFALLRSVTTALLHDLNVTLVAEQMARDAPVIFVDFVDYDEIAHHAGPSRPESMRSLDGLDRVLRFFEDVASETNRRYEIVVLSDHGQAQGTTFAQLAGRSLDSLVAELAADTPEADARDVGPVREDLADDRAERWGSANLLLTSAARSDRSGLGTALARRRARRQSQGAAEQDVAVTLRRRPQDSADTTADGPAGPLVAASGSLAHIYLESLPGRVTRQQIDARHPALLPGLAAHEGIGLVMVHCEDAQGPIVLGADGWRSLAATAGDIAADRMGGAGPDPTEVYGPQAARDLLQLDGRAHVGDIVVLGRFDPDTGEVAAFEELVGSHGGLGGDQTAAMLVVPASWPHVTGEVLVGSEDDRRPLALSGAQVHEALLTRLRDLGLRPGDEPVEAPAGAPVSA